MDPHAAWAKAVAAAADWERTAPEEDSARDQAAAEMAEAILDLNEWLANGGFPPEAARAPLSPQEELEAAAARIVHPAAAAAENG